MVPAGYLLKRVSTPPGWLKTGTSHVTDVCSVADCVNDNVVDVQDAWQHNAFGLANDPRTLWDLVSAKSAELCGAVLFYYEAYEQEMESDGWSFDTNQWRPLSGAPSASVATDVAKPKSTRLLGYDVAVFGDFLEHSPLSCNSLAEDLAVNEHCLFNELSDAVAAINTGGFGGGCEEGVYKVFSVNVVEDLHTAAPPQSSSSS
jgi:hypothetical protein